MFAAGMQQAFGWDRTFIRTRLIHPSVETLLFIWSKLTDTQPAAAPGMGPWRLVFSLSSRRRTKTSSGRTLFCARGTAATRALAAGTLDPHSCVKNDHAPARLTQNSPKSAHQNSQNKPREARKECKNAWFWRIWTQTSEKSLF